MSQAVLYPLRFEPIFQYRLWGGRRLAALLSEPLPNNGPVGEAWILSDREDHASRIAAGPLKGQNLGQLMEQFQDQLMGKLAQRFRRFPLLLKFLDAHEMLSVQVHPGYTDGGLRRSYELRAARSEPGLEPPAERQRITQVAGE